MIVRRRVIRLVTSTRHATPQASSTKACQAAGFVKKDEPPPLAHADFSALKNFPIADENFVALLKTIGETEA